MDKSRSISLRIGAGAHRGLVREENQDRISRVPSPFGELFIVADGMGGHEGGATAAQMLIDGLGKHLGALPPETPPDEALRRATERTNDDIYRRAQGGDRRLAKMGATGVFALLQGNRAWIAHAGDSRAYLWRGGQLRRLTRDHTLVQRMVDHQILNEEEARHHPDANVVTRAFGQTPETELEIAPPLDLLDGDRLLLCSDGLSGYVEDAAIAQVLAADGDAQAATDALLSLALQAGGQDNVSVQLLAVQGEHGEKAPATAAPSSAERIPPGKIPEEEPRRGVSGFLLLLPLILVAVLAGFLLPWRSWLAPEPAAPVESTAQPTTPERTDLTDLTDPTDPFAAAGTVPLGTEFSEPSLPEPASSEALQAPRLTVLSPAGAQAPAVKQRVLRAYPGNWSAPASLEDRLAGALEPGRVYFRPGFGPAAGELGRELGYAAAPWPAALAQERPDTDLLVIYGGAP